MSLISGPTSRQKRFLIDGMDSAELLARLAKVLGEDG
jgi:uncharacterized protein YggU (UPF0235/DUF167 family)